MGKARSYEIIEYRNKIMTQICKSKELIKLLGCEKDKYPEDTIPFKVSFPHEYVPEVITKTERYVNFDISASLDPRNNVYKDLTIYFFVTCHKDVVPYKENGKSYLWYDRVVCELDNIFCDKDVLGIGKTYLLDNKPYMPHQEFKGRILKFAVKDFNNGLKYGK